MLNEPAPRTSRLERRTAMRRVMRYLFILFLIVMIGGFLAHRLLRAPAIKSGSYLLLDVGGSYSEGPPPDLIGSLLRRRERTLIELITMIREAQVDQRIKGVIVK